MEEFKKLINLIGEESFNKMQNMSVIVFGIGGVGGYVAEALARSGIGKLTLVDFDKIEKSNINRQIIALNSTVGKYKVDIMEKRISDINPNCYVETLCKRIDDTNVDEIDFKKYDYVVDAIDMVSSKLAIIRKSKKSNVEIISCMGTGNKLDPSKLEIADIANTSVCPLARVMRKLLKEEGIKNVKVIYSKEIPKANVIEHKPQSAIFVPAVAGLMIANYIFRILMEK